MQWGTLIEWFPHLGSGPLPGPTRDREMMMKWAEKTKKTKCVFIFLFSKCQIHVGYFSPVSNCCSLDKHSICLLHNIRQTGRGRAAVHIFWDDWAVEHATETKFLYVQSAPLPAWIPLWKLKKKKKRGAWVCVVPKYTQRFTNANKRRRPSTGNSRRHINVCMYMFKQTQLQGRLSISKCYLNVTWGGKFVLENCQTNAFQNQCSCSYSHSFPLWLFSNRYVYVSDSFHISFSPVSLPLLSVESWTVFVTADVGKHIYILDDSQPVNKSCYNHCLQLPSLS